MVEAQLWLRPGDASCGNTAVAFFQKLWANRPRYIRLRRVRADSGFCLPEKSYCMVPAKSDRLLGRLRV